MNIEERLSIKELINGLQKKEKEIIVLRYYKSKTQMQVAKILGITQVQVSRIEKKVLSSMRFRLAS
jgi:RNA polymerase sporulation-specific sigma factor